MMTNQTNAPHISTQYKQLEGRYLLSLVKLTGTTLAYKYTHLYFTETNILDIYVWR